jgi:hypothetical protein
MSSALANTSSCTLILAYGFKIFPHKPDLAQLFLQSMPLDLDTPIVIIRHNEYQQPVSPSLIS